MPTILNDPALAIAKVQNMQVDQVVAFAFAEQLAITKKRKERAEHTDRENFPAVLAKAPNVEPEEHDRI